MVQPHTDTDAHTHWHYVDTEYSEINKGRESADTVDARVTVSGLEVRAQCREVGEGGGAPPRPLINNGIQHITLCTTLLSTAPSSFSNLLTPF